MRPDPAFELFDALVIRGGEARFVGAAITLLQPHKLLAAERIVCSDGQLAALDVKMAQMYQQGLRSVSDPNAFRGEQQVWLSQRDVCTDKPCLANSYDERIKELERWIGP